MKNEMLVLLNRHYKSHKELAIATLLDLWFKDTIRSKACKLLEACTAEISDNEMSDNIEVAQSPEPLPKLPRPAIFQCFTEILEQSGVTVSKWNDTLESLWLIFVDPIRSAGRKKISIDLSSYPSWQSIICLLHQHQFYLKDYQLQEIFMMKSVIGWCQRGQRCYYLLTKTFS